MLVSSAGIHDRGEQPFDLKDPGGDESIRRISGDAVASELIASHAHYDTSAANSDVNVIFPIDVLRSFRDLHVIGRMSPVHFGFMGFIPDSGKVRRLVTSLVAAVEEASPDVVVLSPGWPMCHRSVGLVQCAIERIGIPTVSVTVRPEISCRLRVPRAGYVRFPTGQVFGEPHQSWQHQRVLGAILELITVLPAPGIVDLPFRWRRWPVDHG